MKKFKQILKLQDFWGWVIFSILVMVICAISDCDFEIFDPVLWIGICMGAAAWCFSGLLNSYKSPESSGENKNNGGKDNE